MPIPPYDGTIWDNGDVSQSFGGNSFYGHGTYTSASCGGVTVGYSYHLPPTWFSQPTRKFPVVYVPSLGGFSTENTMWDHAQNSDPLQDASYSSLPAGNYNFNWGTSAKCVTIFLNGGLDVPYPFDAKSTADMHGVLMLESQTSEIIDFMESPSHPVFGGRLVPQGTSDTNGGKYRGLVGHSGGTHHAAYHAAKHPDRYSSVFLLAVSGGAKWDPTFTTGFANWQIHMCDSDEAFGSSIWAINRPDGAFGETFVANQTNIFNAGLWWHMQVSHPENINETVSDAFWNNLNNGGFNVDAEVKIPFGWHTPWAYTAGGGPQPLPWSVSKFKLNPSPNPGSYSTPINTALHIAGSALVSSDTDPQILTLSPVSVQNPVNGTVALSGGTVTFTPTTDFTGAASFDYTETNTDGQTASATVSVTVTTASTTDGIFLTDASGVALTSDEPGFVGQHLVDNSSGAPPPNLVMYWAAEGDSRTAADGIHVPAVQMYPELIAANHASAITLNNVAISGSFLSDGGANTDPGAIISRGPAVDALIAANPGYSHYLLTVWIGANDSHLGGDPNYNMHTYTDLLAAYCDARRAAGWTIIVATEIAEFAATDMTNYNNWVGFRAVFNPVVRTFPVAHTDEVVEFANTTLGPAAAAVDTSLFLDTIHPTVHGQAILAGALDPLVAALLAGPVSSVTTLVSNVNPVAAGQGTTLTATVTPSSPVPTGMVNFLDGIGSIGHVALNGAGQASLIFITSVLGHHSITASYVGDVNYSPSLSSTLDQIVVPDQIPPRHIVASRGTLWRRMR